MTLTEKIGKNIQSLRKFYGETQNDLAKLFDKSGFTLISNYERGKRRPGQEELKTLADHFSVSVSDLVDGDFSDISTRKIDPQAFLRYINLVFPVVVSKNAYDNDKFRKVYETQLLLRNSLININTPGANPHELLYYMESFWEKDIDDYLDSLEDDGVKEESAANLLSEIFILKFFESALIHFSEKSAVNSTLIKTINNDGLALLEKVRDEILLF